MNAEWVAAITATVAAFIAAGASIFTYSQAISARRQADSSERSAEAAKEQVTVAREAAEQAERQVKHLDRASASSVVSLAAKARRAIDRCEQAALALQLAGIGNAEPTLKAKLSRALGDAGDDILEMAPLFEQNVMANLEHYVRTLSSIDSRLALGASSDNDTAAVSLAQTQAIAALDVLIAAERRNLHPDLR